MIPHWKREFDATEFAERDAKEDQDRDRHPSARVANRDRLDLLGGGGLRGVGRHPSLGAAPA